MPMEVWWKYATGEARLFRYICCSRERQSVLRGTNRESFPEVAVEYGKHVVEDGRVITSAGISAGIDMALRVVARYSWEDIARATARHMEYPYPDGNARRIRI